jgi:hypothetical protein
MHPSKKFRHEKCDIKTLTERKETDYLDVFEDWVAQLRTATQGVCFVKLKALQLVGSVS